MKTPKEWTQNLENGIITEEMLDAALYSVNKRAKNCRDQKRQYSHRYDKYHNADRYAEKESEYYEQKEKLLSALQPMCIHRESLGFGKMRHYDNKPGFSDTLARCLSSGAIRWSNSFVRGGGYGYRWWDDDFCEYEENRTYFFDEELFQKPLIHYYLFYAVGTHSYHSPLQLNEAQILTYAKEHDLEIIDIDKLDTRGDDIIGLCSTSFTGKVIACISEGQYRLTVRDPRTWYQEPERVILEHTVTGTDKQQNICEAISFGWTHELSDAVMNNFDFTEKKYASMVKEIQDSAVEGLRNRLAIVKTHVQERLHAVEKEIEETTVSADETIARRQRKLLNRHLKKIYRPDKDLPSKKMAQDYDIVRAFFKSMDYKPIDISSVADLAAKISDWLDPEHLPDAIQTQIKYQAEQNVICRLEQEYLSEELEKIQQLKRRVAKMFPDLPPITNG